MSLASRLRRGIYRSRFMISVLLRVSWQDTHYYCRIRAMLPLKLLHQAISGILAPSQSPAILLSSRT